MKRAQLTVELFITSSLFVVVFDVDTLKVLFIVIVSQQSLNFQKLQTVLTNQFWNLLKWDLKQTYDF